VKGYRPFQTNRSMSSLTDDAMVVDDAGSDVASSTDDLPVLRKTGGRSQLAFHVLPASRPFSTSMPGSPATPSHDACGADSPQHLPGVGTFGVASDANTRYRAADEDASTVIPSLSTLAHPHAPSPSAEPYGLSRSTSVTSTLTCSTVSDAHEPSAFLAVYDGHGGDAVAKRAAAELHLKFADALARQDALHTARSVPTAFAAAYAELDAYLRAARMFNTGATAVTCYVHTLTEDDSCCASTGGVPAPARRRKVLTTANVGDARAVLCRAGGAVRLSRDHRAADEDERARIEARGGFVCAGRVNGVLEVSRALGDHCFKSSVISVPYVNETVLGEADEFVVLACDGVWDFMDEDTVIGVACDAFDDGASAPNVAAILVKAALAAGSTDNVTVLCVRFTDM
jgi:protein phosphatase PTC1